LVKCVYSAWCPLKLLDITINVHKQ